MMSPRIGMCFDRTYPAQAVAELAVRLEAGGVDQLWIIEDCFFTAGISLAATALARTERLAVGLGILPAVGRNPAITAMELATLAALAPGRLVAGIGHGVQEWMAQIGAATLSPVTTLDEVITVVRRLLRGETVSFTGAHVELHDVRLEAPPAIVPPVLAGVHRPKSLAMAGRVADGLVLAEGAGPAYVRSALDHAGRPSEFRVCVFSALCVQDDRRAAYRAMASFAAGRLATPNPAVDAHPNAAEMRELFAARGADGLIEMPREWWLQLGAIGTFDDAVEHVEALGEAGAHDVSLFPSPDIDVGRRQLDHVVRLHQAVGV